MAETRASKAPFEVVSLSNFGCLDLISQRSHWALGLEVRGCRRVDDARKQQRSFHRPMEEVWRCRSVSGHAVVPSFLAPRRGGTGLLRRLIVFWLLVPYSLSLFPYPSPYPSRAHRVACRTSPSSRTLCSVCTLLMLSLSFGVCCVQTPDSERPPPSSQS